MMNDEFSTRPVFIIHHFLETHKKTIPMDFQQEIMALKEQMEALKAQNQVLKDRALAAEKKEADELINRIFKVIHHGDKLESDFDNLLDKIENDELLIDLGEANNPNSKVLGFQFTKVIFKAAIDNFINDSPVEDKKRFTDVILNVVKNPLVNVLLTTNPVSYLVSKVVDKVADLTTSVKGKHGQRILSVKKAFKQEQIDAFTKEMEKYYPFYDALLLASDMYEDRVATLREQSMYLEELIGDYYSGFLKTLALDPTEEHAPLLRQVQDKFTPPIKDGEPDFRALIEDENNIAANKIAIKFPELRQQIVEVIASYKEILADYLEANLEALAMAKELSQDTAGLEKLEERIKARKKVLSKKVKKVMRGMQ